MRIKSVALIGAGAVGGWFIPGLKLALGNKFYVIASGTRAERLKRDGIVINGHLYNGDNLNIRTAEEAGAEGIDLVLVATKYDGLSDAVRDVKTIVDLGLVLSRREELAAPYGTMVMSCLNGVDSEEILAQVVGWERIIPAFMRVVAKREGRQIDYDRMMPRVLRGLIFGEKDTEEKTERCRAVETLMTSAGIGNVFVPNILSLQWRKFAMNIANNLPQAILGVGFGAYIDSEHVAYIHDCLYVEVMIVAKKLGISFEPEENNSQMAPAASRFSTLQDLDAKRHTEIEMLAGVLIRKANELDISVPFTEYTYHAMKALEEKNDGKFDYSNKGK